MFLFPNDRKPDFPVKHKDPKGVVFSYLFDKTIGHDQIGRVPLTNSGTDLNRAHGSVVASFASGKTDYLSHPHDAWLDIGDDEWITMRVILTMRDLASSANQTFVIKGRSADQNKANYALRTGSSGDIDFYFNQDTNTTYHVWRSTSTTILADDQRAIIELNYQFGNASSIQLWVNGIKYAGSWIAGNGAAGPDTGSEQLSIGRKLLGSTEGMHGDIEFIQVERNVAFKPYGHRIYPEIFKPELEQAFTVSGGAFTLTGDSGSYTYTGTNAELDAGFVLGAISGSYTYSGTNADLNYGFIIAADSGSYTYSGTAAELDAGFAISADSGSYTYSGTNADLNRGYPLSANSGSYTYSGTDATLTFAGAGAFTLTADSGSYTYSGTSAELDAGFVVTANSGSYTYSGTTVTLTHNYPLAADSGSYTYSGTSAELDLSAVLAATSGTYAYTGSNVTLQASGQTWTVQSNDGSIWVIQSNDSSTWTIQ